MANGKSGKDRVEIPYSLAPNSLPENDGYHRVLSHVGSRDGVVVFEGVAEKLPGQTPAGAELVWRSLIDTVMENVVKYQYKCSVDGVSFALAIPGSTTSINGSPSEGAYISITPSTALRGAAVGITPVYSSDEKDVPSVKSVEDIATHRLGVLAGTEAFRVAGSNITASGDDESLTVVAANGTEVVAEVTGEDGYGMFITARLDTALPAGKGKVVLKTRGKRTPEGELRTLVKSVTILAGETPPVPDEPTITGAKTQGDEDDHVNVSGGTLDVTGENLETATAIDLLNDSGELWQTVNATYADGKLIAELEFEDRPSATGAVRVTTAGGSATHNVSYSSH